MPSKLRAAIVALATVLALFAALSAMAKPTHIKVSWACPGKERWRIKTLSDPTADKVKINKVVDTTVAKLRMNKPSVKIGTKTPRLTTERTVYQVTAELVEAKIEADGDVHLVIAEPGQKSQKMIAEFPRNDCFPESTSDDAPLIDHALGAFNMICGKPPGGGFKTLHGLATITGVGFFDVKHGGKGQTGRAPYNRELHPVIDFSATSC